MLRHIATPAKRLDRARRNTQRRGNRFVALSRRAQITDELSLRVSHADHLLEFGEGHDRSTAGISQAGCPKTNATALLGVKRLRPTTLLLLLPLTSLLELIIL